MRALIACLLWLAGVEVLPAIHLATHDADAHHHDGEHIVSDHHGDHDHEHHETSEDDVGVDRAIVDDELDHAPHHHGAGGLAHRATALAPPAPPPTIEPPSAYVAFCSAYVAVRLVTRIDLTPSARGPPWAIGTFT